ncbi:hypothetical protein D1J51_12405 [Leucobacter sp. wl10]|nr:hypothetical protein D1J51_12405 [Leucobacter sp. wl10]
MIVLLSVGGSRAFGIAPSLGSARATRLVARANASPLRRWARRTAGRRTARSVRDGRTRRAPRAE